MCRSRFSCSQALQKARTDLRVKAFHMQVWIHSGHCIWRDHCAVATYLAKDYCTQLISGAWHHCLPTRVKLSEGMHTHSRDERSSCRTSRVGSGKPLLRSSARISLASSSPFATLRHARITGRTRRSQTCVLSAESQSTAANNRRQAALPLAALTFRASARQSRGCLLPDATARRNAAQPSVTPAAASREL